MIDNKKILKNCLINDTKTSNTKKGINRQSIVTKLDSVQFVWQIRAIKVSKGLDNYVQCKLLGGNQGQTSTKRNIETESANKLPAESNMQ